MRSVSADGAFVFQEVGERKTGAGQTLAGLLRKAADALDPPRPVVVTFDFQAYSRWFGDLLLTEIQRIAQSN